MKKNNTYLFVSAVLAIIAAVGAVFGALIYLLYYFSLDSLGTLELSDGSTVSASKFSSLFLALFFIFLVLALILIFMAYVFMKNKNKSYEELHQKSGQLVTAIVLAFIFGGILIGVLALVGYLQKNDGETVQFETATTSTTETSAEALEEKLKSLKDLLDRGEITQAEYDQMREDALKKF